uniref:FYN binding protein a n=1 Tax=Cyprinus carpio carpio TaxID=630221 RepID=A0A9J8BM88_CYPCA
MKANFTNEQSMMSHFKSLAGESTYSQTAKNNQFGSARNNEQNPVLMMAKLKPVDMNKGAGSKPLPKPLLVKPNFTVNSMETRFNLSVSNDKANSDSRSDAVGVKLPNRGKQENAYTQAPTGAGSQSPAKPPFMQKPLHHENISTAPETTASDLSVPKKKPLPGLFVLGKCPAKPQRPPLVNLNKFRENVSNTGDPEKNFSFPPPPPPDRLSIASVTPPPPPPSDFTFPPAPPPMDEEGYYDDTDVMSRTETSLGKSSNDPEESDEEMYEDLDHNWPEDNKELKEEKTTKESKELKKKLEKEEKKRSEQEKKEKKEREKKEQEARKKFKIKGPILVLETVKAIVDHKGGKNKLPLKQGESIEIVRKTENPKDYWLARNTEGHYGFVKPDTLDIVRSTPDGQEVYDDVGADDDVNLKHKGNDFFPLFTTLSHDCFQQLNVMLIFMIVQMIRKLISVFHLHLLQTPLHLMTCVPLMRHMMTLFQQTSLLLLHLLKAYESSAQQVRQTRWTRRKRKSLRRRRKSLGRSLNIMQKSKCCIKLLFSSPCL